MDTDEQPPLRRLDTNATSLADQVVAEIRSAMRSGRLVPGRFYSAYQISELLGVSRSPVREALMKLAEAGVVRMARNRGFTLVVPDAAEIAEIFHLRLLLEVPALCRVAADPPAGLVARLDAELSAMRIEARRHAEAEFMDHDRRFHDLVLSASGNRRLAATVAQLRDVTLTLGASTVDRSRSLTDIADEHIPIRLAIGARDPDAAGRSMTAHLTNTGRLLVGQALQETGDPRTLDDVWREVVRP